MFQDCRKELGEDCVHVRLAEREQTLEESDVPPSPGGHKDEVTVAPSNTLR